MENKIIDKTYQRAMKFVDNFAKKKQGVSNVYVFTSVDRNGNIVDEKYGMNLMTNAGFREIYANGVGFGARDTDGNTVRLYVGTGVSETPYTTSDTNLEIPAFGGLAATNVTTDKAYDYPMYFSKGENDGEGFITLISRFVVAKYPYNISNFPGEYNLTEYGIKHNSTLWTHSRIFDMQGHPASITKDSNIELYITVYMCLSFYESIIINGWSHNRFTMITTNYMMYDRMAWSSKVRIYKRGNVEIDVTDGGTSRTQDTTTANAYTNSTIAPRMILYDNGSNTYDTSTKILGSSYFDGYILRESNNITWKDRTVDVGGFICIEPQFLTTPENISLENYWSGDATVYSGFADKFGKFPSSGTYSSAQWPQMTHFFDASAYVYDWKNDGWTCALDIHNPDDKWYDFTPSQTKGGLPIFYYNNGEILVAYVYQNLQTSDRILGITSGAVTVYATNKYWATTNEQNNQDPDKGWVWIRDYNNIPQACQTARYWITNTNSDSLSFVRESDCFQLLEKGTQSNGYAQYPEYAQKWHTAPIADNYTYGWYKRGNTVYVPDYAPRTTFTVGSASDETMTYGKWMVVFTAGTNTIIRVDMTNARTGTVSPENVTLPFTGNASPLNSCHRTESETGLIVLEASSIEETVVIDMRQNGFSMSTHSWKHACCIWGTNMVAYINAGSSDLNVYVYDYDTNQIVYTIPFPDATITDIPHLFGHTHYLWMTNGSNFGYVCDLNSVSLDPVGFIYAGLYGTGLNTVKYTCVDDVFIVYKTDECGNREIPKAHYIKLSDPEKPQPLTDFDTNVSSDIGGRIDIVLRYANKHTNALSQPSGAIVMLINRGYTNGSSRPNGADCRVADFGQYLRTGVVKWYVHSTAYEFGNLCLYGENIIYRYTKKIPLINYLPIKLVGKTDTINATQYIKNITNKSWLIGYTNTPSWGDGSANPDSGMPPGIPLATTDGTGVITGWSW